VRLAGFRHLLQILKQIELAACAIPARFKTNPYRTPVAQLVQLVRTCPKDRVDPVHPTIAVQAGRTPMAILKHRVFVVHLVLTYQAAVLGHALRLFAGLERLMMTMIPAPFVSLVQQVHILLPILRAHAHCTNALQDSRILTQFRRPIAVLVVRVSIHLQVRLDLAKISIAVPEAQTTIPPPPHHVFLAVSVLTQALVRLETAPQALARRALLTMTATPLARASPVALVPTFQLVRLERARRLRASKATRMMTTTPRRHASTAVLASIPTLAPMVLAPDSHVLQARLTKTALQPLHVRPTAVVGFTFQRARSPHVRIMRVPPELPIWIMTRLLFV
jgi:hypothetical protein